jgi:hypothetical protein
VMCPVLELLEPVGSDGPDADTRGDTSDAL